MTEQIDTIIIGGGQGGLSTSYHLTQQGREHVILEQADQAAEVWRNRWDSFTLNTPNWMTRLPGAEYNGDDPDGFIARDGVVAYFEEYIERFELPVRYGIRVTSVKPIETGYLVRANEAEFEAANVVIATGLFQQPKVPPFSTNLPSQIRQLHTSEYQNPEALPPGAVLVVGSAQSGCQIAEELYQCGRKVYLSVSSAGRLPRRYRGEDITRRLFEIGFVDRPVDKLPSPKAKFAGSAHSTGKDGGHTINLHQFARDGVVLLGHIHSVQGDRIILAPDLKENLAKADKLEADIVKQVDEYIEINELDVPIETLPDLRDGYEAREILELELEAAGITSVIWATGYKFDFGIVKLPAFDADGYPLQQRGVTEFPGLYFIGLPFLHTFKSGILAGVGDDAAHVAEHISSRVQLTA
jgi:putative flavoprotein involved in K+ transport